MNERTRNILFVIGCLCVFAAGFLIYQQGAAYREERESIKEAETIEEPEPVIEAEPEQEEEPEITIDDHAAITIDTVSMTIESINKVEMDGYKLPEGAVVPDGTELLEFSYKLENPEDGYLTGVNEFDFYLMNEQGQIEQAGDDFDTEVINSLANNRSTENSLHFAIKPNETFYIVESNGAEYGLNTHGTNTVEDIEPLIKLEQGFKFTPDGEGYKVEAITGDEAAKVWNGYMPKLYELEADINAKLGR